MIAPELERPRCACHDEPMRRGNRVTPWRCRVRARELDHERSRRKRALPAEEYAAWRAKQNASRRRWYAGLADDERAAYVERHVYAWRRTPTGKASRAATLQQRRAAKADTAATFDVKRDREALLAEYGDRCAYCGARGELELDHDVPLAWGGEHVWRNIVPACVPCNRSKAARLDGFAFVLERLERH